MNEPAAADHLTSLPQLWELALLARQASSDRELGFLLVNQTLALTDYRQAALWLRDEGVYTLSGVVQIEANAPYVLWVRQVALHLSSIAADQPRVFTAQDLPELLSRDWEDWWPAHGLWIPDGLSQDTGLCQGGTLWVRESSWLAEDLAKMQAWSPVWWHAFRSLHKSAVTSWSGWLGRIRRWLKPLPDVAWHRQRRHRLAMLIAAVLLFPVRLSVLAPGELVPAHPLVMRSPLDAVIDSFQVQPNQLVKKDQPLFSFDQVLIHTRTEVAQQLLATAQAEYRQTYQMALSDPKSKAQLALLAGKIEEKRAELAFAQEQQHRTTVLAPQAGIVLMDDPSEWIGKPVAVGERILRIATPGDIEIEAWIPLNDAIELPEGASVNLYLNASPLSPVSAQMRYLAHDAVQRPDGTYAYRLRASLTQSTDHRVGLKGTVRVQGTWAPLIYGVLRRPIAAVRTYLGV